MISVTLATLLMVGLLKDRCQDYVMRVRLTVSGVILVFAACASATPRETAKGPTVSPVPAAIASRVRLAVVASKLDRPLGMAYAEGDPIKRLFIVEKGGTIRAMKKGGAPVL